MRTEGARSPSPRAVWYCYLVEVTNRFAYTFVAFFLHYIPAYIMDTVGTLTGNMPKDVTS